MNKKILLITQPSGGGAERMTLLYGKIWEKAGYDINLYLMQVKGKPTNNFYEFIPENWNVKLKMGRFRYFFFYLLKFLFCHKQDVIFTSLTEFNIIVLLLKKLRVTKSKIVIRECNMPSRHSANELRLARRLYKYSDIIISQTEEMKAEMLSYYHLTDEQVIVINNPIDSDLIKQKLGENDIILKPGFINFMACGRVDPQKDIITLIKAFGIVKKSIDNAKLYIIGRLGTDEYMQEIEDEISVNDINKCVCFVGFQSNPYKYLKHADVFVLSSVFEGLPNVMLEAMFLGKPVAATNCIPYISQVIKNGVNGFTCPPQNATLLADCMIKAMRINNLPLYNDINKSDEKVKFIIKALAD